jgi:hypothetical protein
MSSGPGLYVHYHSDGDPDPQKVHDWVDLSTDGSVSPTVSLALAQERIREYIEQHGPLDLLKFDYVPALYTEGEAKDLGLGLTQLFTDPDNPRVTHSVITDTPDGE